MRRRGIRLATKCFLASTGSLASLRDFSSPSIIVSFMFKLKFYHFLFPRHRCLPSPLPRLFGLAKTITPVSDCLRGDHRFVSCSSIVKALFKRVLYYTRSTWRSTLKYHVHEADGLLHTPFPDVAGILSLPMRFKLFHAGIFNILDIRKARGGGELRRKRRWTRWDKNALWYFPWCTGKQMTSIKDFSRNRSSLEPQQWRHYVIGATTSGQICCDIESMVPVYFYP